MKRPANTEVPDYFLKYINLVPDGSLVKTLEKQHQQFGAFFASLNDKQASFRYDEDKWSIREVIGHVVDVEMVFCIRALGISRGDSTNFPGFDENAYVQNSRYDQMDLSQLVEMFYNCRRGTISLFASMDERMAKKTGTVNSNTFSVRAIGYIIAGHLMHHMQVINERYLKKMAQK